MAFGPRAIVSVKMGAEQVMYQAGMINILCRLKYCQSAVKMMDRELVIAFFESCYAANALNITEDKEIRRRVAVLDRLQRIFRVLDGSLFYVAFSQHEAGHIRVVFVSDLG